MENRKVLTEKISNNDIFDVLGIEGENRRLPEYRALLKQFRELAKKYDPNMIWLAGDHASAAKGKIIDKTEDLIVVDPNAKEESVSVEEVKEPITEEKLNELDDGDLAFSDDSYDDSWKKDAWKFVFKKKGEDEEHSETMDYGVWPTLDIPDGKTDEDVYEYWYITDVRHGDKGVFASYPNPLPKDIKECDEALKEDCDDIDMKALEFYVKNWEEGDNITVTADLLNVLEQSLEMAKKHCNESLTEDEEEPVELEKEVEVEVEEPKADEPKLETFDEQMDFLAKDEQEAIDGYDKVLALVDDEHVKEQLEHIREEEIAHKEFLEAVKEDKSLVYSHEDKEEEPKEDKVDDVEVIDDIEDLDFDDDFAFGESLNEEDDYFEDDYPYDGVHLKFRKDFNKLPNAEENFDSVEDAIAYGKAHPDFEPECVYVTHEDEDEVVYEFGLKEDTVKKGNKWVNKGDEGTHGEFKTKKEADAQRKAMFANGYHEDLDDVDDEFGFNYVLNEDADDDELNIKVDWNDLDDEDKEIIDRGNKAEKKLMGVKAIRDGVIDHTLKDFPEKKRDVIKKAFDMHYEEPIEEEHHNTGHIKAKKPIELKAREN